MANGLAIVWAVLIVAGIGGILVAVLVIPMKLLNRNAAKNQVEMQIALWKAQAEMEAQKTLDWVCSSCGGANHNRVVCEFCGTGKPQARREG